MTKTTNYQLNQWAKSDRVMMDDFNADNTKIDAALKANADTAAAASAAVALCGNCKIYCTSYTGNYDVQSTTMTFPHKPIAVMVCGRNNKNMFAWRGQSSAPLLGGNASVAVTWADRSATWSNGDANCPLNYTGFTHQVIALLDAEN